MNTIEFLRQFRLGGYAVFDFVLSFLVIYLLSSRLSKVFLKFRIYVPRRNWLILTLPASIGVHILVGQKTLMTQNFLDLHDHYILKILLLGLFIFGIRGIKISMKTKEDIKKS